MKELVVISGKGGTGKTSVVASFAALSREAVLADCDVDAADLHLLLAPDIQQRSPFRAGAKAVIRQEDCIACGACLASCRFGAVRMNGAHAGEGIFSIDPLACEGCGVCVRRCPVDAIELEERTQGEWYISETRCGPMVHARLGVAEDNSGKLVSLVREEARHLAEKRGLGLVLIDGSPGVGCPVIASITGAALVLAVTEPTVSGLHDLDRVARLAAHFGAPAVVCINKADLHPEMSRRIAAYCREHGLPVVGEVPYDVSVTTAQLARRSVVEFGCGPAAAAIEAVWRNVEQRLN